MKYFLPVLAVSLCSCQGFTETIQSPEGQLAIQQITENAKDAAVQAIGGNWPSAITSSAAAAAGVLALIRVWRGGIESRKGRAPTA